MSLTDALIRVLIKATFYSFLLFLSILIDGSAHAWLLLLFTLAPVVNGITRKEIRNATQ